MQNIDTQSKIEVDALHKKDRDKWFFGQEVRWHGERLAMLIEADTEKEAFKHFITSRALFVFFREHGETYPIKRSGYNADVEDAARWARVDEEDVIEVSVPRKVEDAQC